MPSSRQYRVIGMVALLTLLVLYYITNGERLTHDNEFYKKTVAAIEHKKDAAARQHIMEEEQARQDRVERLQKEHEAAMATATTEVVGAATDEARTGPKPAKQKPIVEDAKKESSGEKSVAGRKKMKDGKVVADKPASDKDDGVAKVGNVEPKTTNVAKGEEAEDDEESEREHQIELELNSILKKGPIIIFSKSYCPYSKKAKVPIFSHHLKFFPLTILHSTFSSIFTQSLHLHTSSNSTNTLSAPAYKTPSKNPQVDAPFPTSS